MIDIKGMDKAEVLAALYNNSKQQGLGFFDIRGGLEMGVNNAQAIIDSGQTSFDYLNGRVMKVDLSGDEFEERLYDRDNGQGAAINAIESIW